MKWSDFYKGAFDVYSKNNTSGENLLVINSMISASLDYESGKIDQAQFELLRRDAYAKVQINAQKQEAELESKRQSALEVYLRTQSNLQKSQQQYQPIYTPPINCRSYQSGNTVNTTCQ